MKEIKLMFYTTDPSPENTGMKQVLFKIVDPVGKIIYDYGYADWLGKEWDKVPIPKGFKIEVHSWANNPDPKHLVEENKIVFLNK